MKDVIAEYRKSAIEKEQIVTVFMLTHNREYYVKLAIESVLKQTYEKFCLIVLDNCSKDNTEAVVTSFDDERVHYLYRESVPEYTNPIFAFNECVTKYLIILHDDDLVGSTYLETVVNEIETNACDVVTVNATDIDENEAIITHRRDFGKIVFSNDEYLLDFINFTKVFVCYPSAIYRKSFYGARRKFVDKKAGPAGDQLIWFQTGRFGGKLCVIGKELIRYRIHSNQSDQNNVGFMDLKLFDYLLGEDYYKVIPKKHKTSLSKRIFIACRTICFLFFDGKLIITNSNPC